MKQESIRLPVKKNARQLAAEALRLLQSGLHLPEVKTVTGRVAPPKEAPQPQLKSPTLGRMSVKALLPKAGEIARAYTESLKSYRELAQQYNCSLPTIQALLVSKGVEIRRPGRVLGKENDGGDQQTKITSEQRAWLLEQDLQGVKRSVIADKLGISRERVRQLCERAGHTPIPRRKAELRETRALKRVHDQTMRRIAVITQPPSADTVAASTMWNLGRSIAEIADKLGRSANSLGVEISRWRKRWPSMFKRRYRKHTFQN